MHTISRLKSESAHKKRFLPVDFKQVFRKVPLRFHPGDSYAYGFSTDVLGRVVEIISRKTLEDVLHPARNTVLGGGRSQWLKL